MGTYFSRKYANEWLLVAGLVWLTFEQFIIGKYSWIRFIDNASQAVPDLVASGLAGFDPALWQVFPTAGNDRPSLGYFGPLERLLFQGLPGWLALQIRTVSQCALGALAVYVLCRRTLKLEKFASVVAALLMGHWASGAQMLLSVDAYLPLSLVAVSLVLEQRTHWRRWLLLGAVGLLLSHTAYVSRLMPFVFLVHLLWFAIVERRKLVADWLVILGFSLFTVVIRAQDFLAVLIYGRLSDRHATVAAYDLSFQSNIEHIVSYYFGSPARLFAMLLIGCGLVAFGRRYGEFVRLMAAFLMGLAMVAVLPLVKPLMIEIVPVAGTFKLMRFYKFLFPFAAMGAGFGVKALMRLDRTWIDERRRGWRRWLAGKAPVAIIVVLVALTLPGKYGNLREWVSEGSYVLNFESPVLKALAADIRRSGKPVRAASFQMYPNAPHAYGIETADGFQVLHLRRYVEFWTKMIEAGQAKTPPQDRENRTYLLVNPAEHRPQWELAELFDPELLALANVRYLISRDRITGPGLVSLHQPETPWSALGVREKIETNLRANFTGRTHLYVYEYAHAFPRFFVAPRVRVLATGAEVLDAMAAAGRDELAKTAFVEASALPPGLTETSALGRGSVRLERYAGDEIRLTVDLDGAAVLVVTNAFSPYWKSYVDGVETPIFPADHAFWGVALPAAARQVVFRYEPPYRLF